jgi:capsular polysaccharide transport system permease protein
MSIEVGYARLARENAGTSIGQTQERKGLSGIFNKRNSFLMFVLMPCLLGATYYFGIASSQYVSETRLVVRTIGVSERFDESEKREGRSIVGGDSLTQDSYIVANYLKSPQLVRKLEEEIGLRNLFSRSGIDPLSRLSADASFEDLHDFWQQHVDTYVDGPSGIIIFTVRAFSPTDSVEISKVALSAADEMIDLISERAKNDLVTRGEHDVVLALEDYQTALGDLRDYQNKTGILDPASSAKMTSTIIGKLTEQKLQLQVSLNSLIAAKADDTARARQLRRSIEAIDDQIQLRQNSLAGTASKGEPQLSSSMTEFARLETHRIVTQALYESTVKNLDTAKSTALKRTTFISIFSDAHIPEKSKYPHRVSQWLILSAGLLTLWMTGTLIWMSIEDHRV